MEFTLNPHTNFLTTANVKPRDLFRIGDTWFFAIKDDKDYFDDFHGLNAIELPCCGYRAFLFIRLGQNLGQGIIRTS